MTVNVMKLFSVLLLLLPFSVSAGESIICVNNNIQLSINVFEESTPKSVSWIIQVVANPEIAISGYGAYQKEVETDDAFSSFDDNSAVSYKDKRAVFVMGNNQSINFLACVNN